MFKDLRCCCKDTCTNKYQVCKARFNPTFNSTNDHTMLLEYGRLMTAVICHVADLKKKKEHLKMTQKDNFIVILKRIYEINGRRSMLSLPALSQHFT